MQKRIPKNFLTKSIFRGLDLYLGSDDLGIGSDRVSSFKANAKHQFQSKVSKIITGKKLLKIEMKKY